MDCPHNNYGGFCIKSQLESINEKWNKTFYYKDLTGLIITYDDLDPCMDDDERPRDFREDLSGLLIITVEE